MTLIQLFTAIANAIRAKLGTSDPIPAEDFPTEIAGINTGKLTNEEYDEANDDLDDILEDTTIANVYPPDWSELGYDNTPLTILEGFDYAKQIYENWDSTITNMNDMFRNDKELKYLPSIDTSNVSLMYRAFASSSIEKIPLIDTSNATNIREMFYGCANLKEIPALDTSKATDMRNTFSGCSSLRTIPILSLESATNMSGMFLNTNVLNDESLNNILAMCIGATSYTGTKTLSQIGLYSTYYPSEKIQALSNYQDFIDAGWTIGY